MGCGSSGGQVTQSYFSINSNKPLKLQEIFQSTNATHQTNKIYLFGETQTKRKILQLSFDSKSQSITLEKVSQRYHIPRPKIQVDAIEMMYEQAQQVLPLSLYNSTTLPPFNQMFVTPLSEKLLFMCGGIDYEFWNICAETFLYKINSLSAENERTIKKIPQKPQTSINLQKQKVFNKFQRLGFMNQARYSHMGLSIKHPITGKNVVYVFGGFNLNKQALKSCQMYSFEKSLWQKIDDMSIPRAAGFCFHYLDKIYVCGGYIKDEKRSKKIEVFDLTSNTWSLLKIKLHHGIQQGFITSFRHNEIVIMGGNTQGGSTNSVIRFNLIEETYKWDSDLLHVDSLQKGIHFYNKFYLLGGERPDICQVYNPKTRQWKQSQIVTSEDIKPGELTLFSALTKPIFVDFIPWTGRRKLLVQSQDDFLIFGTDHYPMLQFYHSKDLIFSSKAVPMRLRLRKNMGILRLSLNEYFICGGVDSFQTNATKATFNYNSSLNTVQQLDKMPIKKYKSTLIKHKHFVYNVGGMKPNNKRLEVDLKDCCRYNILLKKWEKVPEMIFRRSQCQVVEFEKGLIVFGGYCDGEWVEAVEYLNTQDDKSLSFITLTQKIPFLFPFHSIAIPSSKPSSHLRIFLLTRNIHTSNFQSLYIQLNITKVNEQQLQLLSDRDSSKLKQIMQSHHQKPERGIDSIDVLIECKEKMMEKIDEEGQNRRKKGLMSDSVLLVKEGKESGDGKDIKEKPQLTMQNIKQSSKRSLSLHDKIIASSSITKQPQILPPQVNLIQIRSKLNDQSQQQNDIQSQSQISNIEDERNQIQEKFVDDQEKIEEMSMEFEKLSARDDGSGRDRKGEGDNKGKKGRYEIGGEGNNENERKEKNEKMPQLQDDLDQSIEYIPHITSLQAVSYEEGTFKNIPIANKIIPSNQQPQSSPYVSFQQRQIITGLQIISNPNEWLRISESTQSQSMHNSRVIFVRGMNVIKCAFIRNQDEECEIKCNIIKETYESADSLSSGDNVISYNSESQLMSNNLLAGKIQQNYA